VRSDLLQLYQAHVAEIGRRAVAALARSGFDGVVIHSGSLNKRSLFDDVYWPLRLVPHFQHWAYLPWPDAVLSFREGARPRVFYVRDRSFWERPEEPDFDALGATLDLVELSRFEQIKDEIAGPGRRAVIAEDLARAAQLGFDAPSTNPPDLLRELDAARVHKTPFEIECIQAANRIAVRGHRAVRQAFEGGERSEFRLHLAYLEATEQDDTETPYKNIVAIGEHAATLHHIQYRRSPLSGPQSLLLDAGATFLGYASDITRTYAGADAADFRALIAALEALQQDTCRAVQIGRPYESLHDESHRRMAKVLKDAGILRASEEVAVTAGITRMFFPHGLGHSLGLQTHDVGCARIKPRGDNPFLRNTSTIEPAQVFTVEPGLYFIDTFMESLAAGPHRDAVDWKRVDSLRPFGGIRIEDDILVRAEGPAENLTREAFAAS
jgi:Xaa-Pro dipeptidase